MEQLCGFEVGANRFLGRPGWHQRIRRSGRPAQGFYAEPAGPGEQIENVYISEEKRLARMLKTDSLTRSAVGRTLCPLGTTRVSPPAEPEMTRI